MEDFESLVGGKRKRLNTRKSSQFDILAAWIQRNLLTAAIGIAGIAMMIIFLVSMKSNAATTVGGGGGGTKPVGTAKLENPAPSPPTVDESASPPLLTPTEPPTVPPYETPTENTSQSEQQGNPDTQPTVQPTMKTDNGANSKADLQETEDIAAINMYSKFSTFKPLANLPLPDTETASELSRKWGNWHFWDGDEDVRPQQDFISKYPNKDCPADDFPDEAWQADAVYVNHYLNDAQMLISRAMDAIFAEYGYPREGLSPQQLSDRLKRVQWEKIDLASATAPPPKYQKRGDRGNGGWTTKRSEAGLIRRLLHAMMTSDTFTVVMGGHSASAGEGNHFRQSYMMQFHKVMAPVFAHLGVKLITRNVGMGGLGTLHNSLGSASIYGDEIDLLLWDTGMTEGSDLRAIDMFIRQALISGKRVPVIWGSGINFDIIKMFHEEADVDVGEFGEATDLLPVVESEELAETIPWAARYMKCSDDAKPLCQEEPRFCTVCWVDREDGITPTQKQRDAPRGQVSWHPGWRPHQLIGRNLALGILRALQSAVTIWIDQVSGGPPLSDEEWHVTQYYENIRQKVLSLNSTMGHCHEFEGLLPSRFCYTPMKAATQYTPRANPEQTALSSLAQPAPDGYVPKNEKKLLFDGPDPPNQCLQIPDGEVDVYAIVAGRRRLEHEDTRIANNTVESSDVQSVVRKSEENEIVPGRGWEVFDEPSGYCDGTYNSICHRESTSECVLQGQQASRGAILGNEFSGWLVLNLPDVKEGIIVLKLQTWHNPEENTVTTGWSTVNDEPQNEFAHETRLRRNRGWYGENNQLTFGSSNETEYGSRGRRLWRGTDTPQQPEDMVFEYAIDGVITTLGRDEFLEQKKLLQRVVETLTILDDPNFTSVPKTVEVAIRMRGCGRQCTFGLSHIYWA